MKPLKQFKFYTREEYLKKIKAKTINQSHIPRG